jgi:polysaccharide export outer membrane protein
VQVFGEQTLTQQLTVARDGSITMPLVGRVVVQGRSTTDAAKLIATNLGRYVRHPIVQVGIKTEGQYNVLVLGNVKTPGRYTVQAGSRVTDAIAAAGGIGPVNGLLPAARVSVGNSTKEVPLEALLRRGDVALNLPLTDGSAVYVPSPETIRVRVLGAVDHPGEIEVNEGDRLAVAVAKAGNSVNANADLNHIKVTRASADGQEHVTEINLYKSLSEGDFKSDLVLEPNDTIYIPQGHKSDATTGVLGVLRRLFIPF